MIKQMTTRSVQFGLKYLGIFVLSLICQHAFADADDFIVQCPETAPGSQIYDLEACEVTDGHIGNSSILDLSADLLQVLGKDLNSDFSDPGSDCSIVNGEINCQLGAFDIDMGCSVATDDNANRSVSCTLQTDPDDSSTVFFELGCSETGAAGKCEFQSDSSVLSDLVNGQFSTDGAGDNLSSIADSLLSCVSRNTFDSFQNVCDKIITTLQQPGGAAIVAAFIESIQPLNPDASTDTSVTAIKQALTNLGQRLNNIRSGGGAIASNTQSLQYYDGQQWLEGGDLLASNNNIANDASREVQASSRISDYGRLSVFVNAATINTDQSGDDVETGSETDTIVLTVGVDYRFSDHMVAGVAYNLGSSDTEFDVSGFKKGSLDTETHMLTLFGTYYTNNWFFDGSLSFGGDDYEQERFFKCVSVTNECIVTGEGVAEATYHSSQTTLSLSSGYDWSYRSFNVTPYAQFIYGRVEVDSYSERSKDSVILAVEIDEQEKDISTLNLGANFQYIVNTQKGVFIPMISMQLIQELEDDTAFVTGRFVGNKANGGDFRLETNEVDSSYSIIGAGCTLQLKNGNAGFVNIQKTVGYENIDQTRFTLGWRWEI